MKGEEKGRDGGHGSGMKGLEVECTSLVEDTV